MKRPAPLKNLSLEPVTKKNWKVTTYRVNKSDTLYSIAFRFGIDFQQLAANNQITVPYTIYPGQLLQLQPGQVAVASKAVKKSSKGKTSAVVQKINHSKSTAKTKVNSRSKTIIKPDTSIYDKQLKVASWSWPVSDITRKKFSTSNKHQGINISGRLGEPVKASAAGRVVYSGDGLVGYGNLIIIKHSQNFLSAYAHNNDLLVSEKDRVKVGQKIATMGKNSTGQIQLHFEIRYQGRPVNALKYLPSIH